MPLESSNHGENEAINKIERLMLIPFCSQLIAIGNHSLNRRLIGLTLCDMIIIDIGHLHLLTLSLSLVLALVCWNARFTLKG